MVHDGQWVIEWVSQHFPTMGVSQNGGFIRETLSSKMDELGVPPWLDGNLHILGFWKDDLDDGWGIFIGLPPSHHPIHL